jgi:hypothetical protein
MKKTAFLVLALIFFNSCKKEVKQDTYSEDNLDVTTTIYPDNISKIFDAHGGIDEWNDMKGINYGIQREDYVEKHNVNLKSRKSVIEYKHHLLGFDGENVWVKNLDTTTYKGNPRFYYNLYFYFYAMPFIIGDNGITYEEGPTLEVDGKEYPGILISYEAGIGESPEDQYILYYDPDTYKMTWLAYTVTFFTKEKAKKFKLIKYSEWATVNGLQLPSKMQWHQFDDGEVGEMSNEVNFINAYLSKESPDDTLFNVAEGAIIAE